jgi:hypothetical protein
MMGAKRALRCFMPMKRVAKHENREGSSKESLTLIETQLITEARYFREGSRSSLLQFVGYDLAPLSLLTGLV